MVFLWLDMKKRIMAKERVDSKNLKKHKNDVFRLLANVPPTLRVDAVEEIRKDVEQFIHLVNEDKPDLKNLGLRNANFNELVDIIRTLFLP